MTVATSYTALTYAGNGSTTAFPVTWPFFDGSLIVSIIDSGGTETVKTITTHYTVSGGTDADGLPATGTVTMLTAPASGETLKIRRDTPKLQSTSWSVTGAFNDVSLEAALDRAILIAQEAVYTFETITAAATSAAAAATSATAAAASATAAASSATSAQSYYNLTVANYVQPSSTGVGEHILLDSIEASFDGAETTFSLTLAAAAFTPPSAASLLVQVGGVEQKPGTDYTVSGDEITFTTAPEAGDDCNIRALKTLFTAAEIAFTPTGNIAATNMQDAIVESSVEGTLAVNLASTDNAKGASLVGVEDSGEIITATTVEGALAEIATELNDPLILDLIDATLSQGDILYYNGTNLVRLAAGTSGHFLKTQGGAANPTWAALPSGGDMLSSNNLSDVASAATARTNLGVRTAALDDISSGFNDSTTTFSLTVSAAAFTPRDAQGLAVVYNGVLQIPDDAFTVSSDEITFTFTPATGDTCAIWAVNT